MKKIIFAINTCCYLFIGSCYAQPTNKALEEKVHNVAETLKATPASQLQGFLKTKQQDATSKGILGQYVWIARVEYMSDKKDVNKIIMLVNAHTDVLNKDLYNNPKFPTWSKAGATILQALEHKKSWVTFPLPESFDLAKESYIELVTKDGTDYLIGIDKLGSAEATLLATLG